MLDIAELVRDMKKTELIYWKDSYVKSFESEVLRVVPDGRKKAYLILGKTVYHHKGGGQPSDTGTIAAKPMISLAVKKVMMSNGVAVHYCGLLEGNLDQLKPGARVRGEINWSERYSAMKKHTAGHLFDHCLEMVTGKPSKTVESWLGDPCYVTYAGGAPDQSALGKAAELEIEGIRKALPVRLEFVTYEKMLEIAADAPNIERLPESGLMRIVTIEGCRPIPCGGTHVNNTKEIGGFELDKVEEVDEGKAFRVYYNVT